MSIRTRERDLYEPPQLVLSYMETINLTMDQCRTSIDKATLCISIASRYRAILYSSIDTTPQRLLILETTPFGPTDEALSDHLLTKQLNTDGSKELLLGPDTIPQSAYPNRPFIFTFESAFPGIMADLPQTAVAITTDGFLLCFSDLQKDFRRDRLCLVRSRLCSYLNLYPTEFVTAAEVVGTGILPESPYMSKNSKSLRVTFLIGTSLGRVLRATLRVDEHLDFEISKRASASVASMKERKSLKLQASSWFGSRHNIDPMAPRKGIVKRTKMAMAQFWKGLLIGNQIKTSAIHQTNSAISVTVGRNSLLCNNKLGIQAYNSPYSLCTLEIVDEPFGTRSLGSHKASHSLLQRMGEFFSGYTEIDRLAYPVALKRQVLLQMKETGHILTKTGGEKDLLKLMKPHKNTYYQKSASVKVQRTDTRKRMAKLAGEHDELRRHNLLNPLELSNVDGVQLYDSKDEQFRSLHQSELDQGGIFKEYKDNARVYFPEIPNDAWVSSFLTLDPVLRIRDIDLETTHSAISGQILIVYEDRVVLINKKVPIVDKLAKYSQKFISNIKYYTIGLQNQGVTKEGTRKSLFTSKVKQDKDQPIAGEFSKDAYDRLCFYGLIERPPDPVGLKICDVSSMTFSLQKIIRADELSTIFPGTRYVSCATETIPRINYHDECIFISMSDCNVIDQSSVVLLYSIIALSESKNLRLLDNRPQEGSVTYSLLYYNHHTNVLVTDILLNPLVQRKGGRVSEMAVEGSDHGPGFNDTHMHSMCSGTMMISHIPVSEKLIPKNTKKNRKDKEDILRDLVVSMFNYYDENFPIADFYFRRPSLDIPILNSKVGYVVTGDTILCTKLLSGISRLSARALNLAYGSEYIGKKQHIYIYNKPGDYFLQYKDELPKFMEIFFNIPDAPGIKDKITFALDGLRSIKIPSAKRIRSEIFARCVLLYYGSVPNIHAVCASRKGNVAFTNRLGLTGKAFDDLMLTRVPIASVLRSPGLSGIDMTYRDSDNIYDSHAIIQLKPHGSERFTGFNFSFPLDTGSICSYGFASRRAIHRKLRLIRTVHLTTILFLTNNGYLRSLSNYIEAMGQMPEGTAVESTNRSLLGSVNIDLFLTSQNDNSCSKFVDGARRDYLEKRLNHANSIGNTKIAPYDLLHASYNAYCSGDALFNLLFQSLISEDLEKLLMYITDRSIINNIEDPIWCVRENSKNDKNFMVSGTLSIASSSSIDRKEIMRHKSLCKLYFKSCIQKIEDIILFITFLKETGLWSIKNLVTTGLKMKIRTYLEGLYAMSGLIKFFYIYTGRGNEDLTLLEADYYSLTFHEYSIIIPEYQEELVCRALQQSIGKIYSSICKTDGNFSTGFSKLRDARLNGFEAILSGVTLTTTEHLPIVHGILKNVRSVLDPLSNTLSNSFQLTQEHLFDVLSMSQSLDSLCIYLQTALVSREANTDLLSISTYTDIPSWLNPLHLHLYDIFTVVCSLIHQICDMYQIVTDANHRGIPVSFGLLEQNAKSMHEFVLVQMVKTSATLADCILHIFYRSKEAGLAIQTFKDKRRLINEELVSLPVKVRQAAIVMAKYHDWSSFVRYSFALFELRDLTPAEISRTVIFHPSLTQNITGLSAYFKEYQRGISASNVVLESTMIPTEAIPVLPHGLLEIMANVIDVGALALDLEPLADLRAVLLDELEVAGYTIRFTLLANEDTNELANLIIALRSSATGLMKKVPQNDSVMEAVYDLAARCSL